MVLDRGQFVPVRAYELGCRDRGQCEPKAVRQRDSTKLGFQPARALPEQQIHVRPKTDSRSGKIGDQFRCGPWTDPPAGIVIHFTEIRCLRKALVVPIGKQILTCPAPTSAIIALASST
jgi:hypothetical protein